MKKYYIIIFILVLAIIGEAAYIVFLRKNYTTSAPTAIEQNEIIENIVTNENNEEIISVDLSEKIPENEKITDNTTIENLITYSNTVVEAPKTIDDVNFPTGYTTDKIVISIKNGSISKSGLTLVIKDMNMTEPVFTENYRLLYNAGGIWATYPTLVDEVTFSTELLIGKNNILEQEINWRDIYGELPTGTYKLEKTEKINNKDVSFTSPIFEIK